MSASTGGLTLYSSITGMYDTFIVSNNTLCDGGSVDEFTAPLSTTACSELQDIETDDIVDCGPFESHPSNSTNLLETYFTDVAVPYYTIDTTTIYTSQLTATSATTTYELSTTNQITTSPTHLFDQNYVSAGEVYVRNVYTQKIDPLSSAFATIFNKHSNSTKTNILTSSNILDFDIIENTICIQTSAETVTELYKFEDGIFKVNASSKSIVT